MFDSILVYIMSFFVYIESTFGYFGYTCKYFQSTYVGHVGNGCTLGYVGSALACIAFASILVNIFWYIWVFWVDWELFRVY